MTRGTPPAVAMAVAALALASCRTSAPAARPAAAQPPPLPPVDTSALDRGTSPCDDFYQFACGGWMARTEIPPDEPGWSRGFQEVEERNRAELRRILEDAAAGKAAGRYARKLGDFWSACMDEAAVEARGLEDLRAEWARIESVRDPASLAPEVARLHLGGTAVLFGFGDAQDARDATQVIGELSQGGLSLPDRDYYTSDDPRMKEIRASYVAHVGRLLALAGVAPEEAARQAADVLALETALAEPQWTQVELRDPARVYNRLDLDGIERLAPRFPWRAYLADVGAPGATRITVTTPRFLERVSELVATTPATTWRAYLRWHLLAHMADARALPRVLVDESFAFGSAAFTGAQRMMPRWKKCVGESTAAMGEALGEAYVERTFTPDAKERTATLVAEIEAAMRRTLEALPWMDGPTREMALAKLSRIVNKVGYPAVFRNYDALEVDRASYFRSILAANRFELRRQLAKIGKPLDRQEWQMPPQEVNAYYEPQLNEMVFPAGILQPPFFNRAAPRAVNDGGIGSVVGHELTHGFDDEGRKYDALGNLRDWWTPAVATEFDRRARCLVDQYAAYEPVPGVHVNGELTLGENIADLGGLRLAFAAHREAAQGRPPEPAVAGFTPDQQIFVAMAQSWCTKMREPFARMLAQTDPHAPDRFRVNGPVSNLPEFAAAFQCPAGSRMTRPPDRRCQIW